jgi:hypothetical protein
MTKKAIDYARDEVNAAHNAYLKKQEEFDRVIALTIQWPDLDRTVKRGGRVFYTSAQVNSCATDVQFDFSCGCCPDPSFLAFPFIETGNGRVYAEPAGFVVGEMNRHGNAVPLPDWEEKLRSAGIQEDLIRLVQMRFEAERQNTIEALQELLNEVGGAE